MNTTDLSASTPASAESPTTYGISLEMQARLDLSCFMRNISPPTLLKPIFGQAGFQDIEISNTLLTHIRMPPATDSAFRKASQSLGFTPEQMIRELINPVVLTGSAAQPSPAHA